jgi:hypothetical protein
MTEFVETASVNKNGALHLAARRQDQFFVVFIHGSVRRAAGLLCLVIAGLDPAIHHAKRIFGTLMDGRVKPGHDG